MNDDILLADQAISITIITNIMLKRGADLCAIKENREYLGMADTFEEYLAYNDVRKDARTCMDLWKFYCCDHKLYSEYIHDIHHDRLLEAKKAIEIDGRLDEWLEACRTLSWKDLINAVRGVRGKPPLKDQSPPFEPTPDSSCIVCGSTPVEQAHWPITEKMGGEFTIPLCRKCHHEYHTGGDVTFYSKYKRRIGDYLNNLGGK